MPESDLFATGPQQVLGFNSGTSVNSLDWALVNLSGRRPRVRVISAGELRYPADLQGRLHRAAALRKIDKVELADLDLDYGRFIGAAARRLMRTTLRGRRIDLIASHGQTIGHWGRPPHSATLQIGDPDQIAKYSGIPVASHFRHGDLAVGGQGAPLTPAVNQLLFSRPAATVGVLNLGGIANLSILPPQKYGEPARGTDCGPANMLLDLVTRRRLGKPFDRDGRVAATGSVDTRLLSELKRHAWFRRPLPASCGQEEFGESYLKRMQRARPRIPVPDMLATFCHLTGWAVARAVARLVLQPRVIYASGGGVHNRVLMRELSRALAPVPVSSVSELGLDPDALEAVSFALLGYLCARRRALDLRGATGASRPAVLGRLSWP